MFSSVYLLFPSVITTSVDASSHSECLSRTSHPLRYHLYITRVLWWTTQRLRCGLYKLSKDLLFCVKGARVPENYMFWLVLLNLMKRTSPFHDSVTIYKNQQTKHYVLFTMYIYIYIYIYIWLKIVGCSTISISIISISAASCLRQERTNNFICTFLTKAACCRNIEVVLHPTILSHI